MRAVRLRAAGLRGDMAEAPFLLQVLGKTFGDRNLHFFITERQLKSHEGQHAREHGPSKAVNTVRQQGPPKSLSNAHVFMHPWIYEPWIFKSDNMCKPNHILRTRGPDSYDPDGVNPEAMDHLQQLLCKIGIHQTAAGSAGSARTRL